MVLNLIWEPSSSSPVLRVLRRLRGVGLLGLVCSGVLSCRGEAPTGIGVHEPNQTYWALQLNQHALNLAATPAYNTFRLVATPINASGTPLTIHGRVRYEVVDADTTVTVDSTGVVTALYVTSAGNPARITVTLQSLEQNVTHKDTVYVQVTSTVPSQGVATFSMQPVLGDSAERSIDSWGGSSWGKSLQTGWPVHVTDRTGATVCDATGCPLSVYYTSSNPSVATIDPTTGQVVATDTGHTIFAATTWYYGVPLRDSVAFTMGYKLDYKVNLFFLLGSLGTLLLGFSAPRKLILGVGAIVTFCAQPSVNRPVDIVFDHPEAVDSVGVGNGVGCPVNDGNGNVATIGGPPAGGSRLDSVLAITACRRFMVPGVYLYHSTLVPSDTDTIVIKRN